MDLKQEIGDFSFEKSSGDQILIFNISSTSVGSAGEQDFIFHSDFRV